MVHGIPKQDLRSSVAERGSNCSGNALTSWQKKGLSKVGDLDGALIGEECVPRFHEVERFNGITRCGWSQTVAVKTADWGLIRLAEMRVNLGWGPGF